MSKYDVLTIGNAIVDIIARVNENFLVENGIIKGAMNLIDAQRANFLYSRIDERIETSGGSAGNTAAGIAVLGGKAAYMGKVAADHLGQIFAHDMRSQGVNYDTKPLDNSAPTARSIIFNTPDGERSMNTYLGACVEFGPEDIEASKVADSKIIYFEGYLWDPPRAKEAMRLAAKIAHEHKNLVAITLSDSFCVERFRDEFLELISTGVVDIVFANEGELLSLFKGKDFQKSLMALRDIMKGFACITRGEQGSVVLTKTEIFTIDAFKVEKVIDQTGAGDAFAAGFLYGYTNGLDYRESAKLGNFCASVIIQQIGPRANFNLCDLAMQAGLIPIKK